MQSTVVAEARAVSRVDIEGEVRAARVAVLYQQTPTVIVVNVLNAALVALVLVRYTAPDGRLDPQWNVNGATNAIAGVLSEKLNVLGLMPHPENHVDGSIGSTDGRGLFAGLVAHFAKAA
jgi:phosphoribosylformylglycinamidine (FGAM) synthase-like amidotransferase family enzyme